MYAPSIRMDVAPTPASRNWMIPFCAPLESTGWQLAGVPVHALPTGQSELSRQMHCVSLLQNGVSPLQPCDAVHTTHTPLPLLAAVSQMGLPAAPAQSGFAAQPQTLPALQTGRVGSAQFGLVTHSTQ